MILRLFLTFLNKSYRERSVPLEFSEKLQKLRKQKDLTQEQLAEQLFVSRTAISKWESGKGYPNIESLKSISKLFEVSIDQLLSGDEIINIATTENHSNMNKVFGYIYAMFDIMAVVFIFLPLYGKRVGNHIGMVNLLEHDSIPLWMYVSYWMIFISIIGLGIIQLLFSHFEKEKGRRNCLKVSFIAHSLAIILFAAAREPYVNALLFLFFTIKVLTLLKEKKTK